MMLLNAFSLNMLPTSEGPLSLSVTRVTAARARQHLDDGRLK